MTRIIALTLALTAGTAAIALTSANEQPVDATTFEMIKVHLASEGYDVTEVELEEDGLFEAEATKDGQNFEIELDAELNIIEIEVEDD